MLSPIQLDNRRAEMMHSLYKSSGRTCGTYTGLWDKFAHDIAGNFRDTDYDDLLQECVTAIGGTDSHLAEHHAHACIAVCRKALLGDRWK